MRVGVGIGCTGLHHILAQGELPQLQRNIPGAAGVKGGDASVEGRLTSVAPYFYQRRGKAGLIVHWEHDRRVLAPVPRHIQRAAVYGKVLKAERRIGVELAVILPHALGHGEAAALERQLLGANASAAHSGIRDRKGAHTVDGLRVDCRSFPGHGEVPLIFGRTVHRKIDLAERNIQRSAADGGVADSFADIVGVSFNKKPIIAARHGTGVNPAAGLDQIAAGHLNPGMDVRKDIGAVRNRQIAAGDVNAPRKAAMLIRRIARQLTAAGDGNACPVCVNAAGKGAICLTVFRIGGLSALGGHLAAGHGKAAALRQLKAGGKGAVAVLRLAAGQLYLAALDRDESLCVKRRGVGPGIAGVRVLAGSYVQAAGSLNGQRALGVNAVNGDFDLIAPCLIRLRVAAINVVMRPIRQHDDAPRGKLHRGARRSLEVDAFQCQRFGGAVPCGVLCIVPFRRVEQSNRRRTAVGSGEVRRFRCRLCRERCAWQQCQTQAQGEHNTYDSSFHNNSSLSINLAYPIFTLF